MERTWHEALVAVATVLESDRGPEFGAPLPIRILLMLHNKGLLVEMTGATLDEIEDARLEHNRKVQDAELHQRGT